MNPKIKTLENRIRFLERQLYTKNFYLDFPKFKILYEKFIELKKQLDHLEFFYFRIVKKRTGKIEEEIKIYKEQLEFLKNKMEEI